jgi:hypothetical protein
MNPTANQICCDQNLGSFSFKFFQIISAGSWDFWLCSYCFNFILFKLFYQII